jgi:hypothetical protein
MVGHAGWPAGAGGGAVAQIGENGGARRFGVRARHVGPSSNGARWQRRSAGESERERAGQHGEGR